MSIERTFKLKEVRTIIRRLEKLNCTQATINCDYINAISYQDIIELYVYLQGVKKTQWQDAYGNKKEAAKPYMAIWNIFIDVISCVFIGLKYYLLTFFISLKRERTFHISTISKILYARTDHWFNLKAGGSVGHTSGVIDALRELDIDVKIVSSDFLTDVNNDKDFTLLRPYYGCGRNIPPLCEFLYSDICNKTITQQIKAHAIDAVYHRMSFGNLGVLMASLNSNIPYIVEFNGPLVWVSKNWETRTNIFHYIAQYIEKVILRSAYLIVTTSEPNKTILLNYGVDHKKILVNPNGVDERKFHPNINPFHLRKKLNTVDNITIGFIGTFSHWHGAEILAKAYSKLLKSTPHYRGQVKLIMIGDGLFKPQCEEILQAEIMAGHAVFTGVIRQQSAPEYLASCDILVSPHVPNTDGTEFFGSPTKLFEYMAMGKAIVASKLAQIGDVMVHEKTALLVTPDDVDELEAALKKLICSKKLRDELGQNARHIVLEHYTWQKHAERIIQKAKELND